MPVGERPGERPDDDPHDDPRGEGSRSEPTARAAGAPPDPLDRLWVHPTELGAIPAPSPSQTPRATAERRRAATSWLVPLAAGAAGALATVGVLTLAGTLDNGSVAAGHASSTSVTTSVLASDPATAIARLGASVVAVSVHDATGVRRGSGICVRHGGGVLTTLDVVGTASTVNVETSDGTRHTAQVVGRDRVTDLALLALPDAATLPAAQLADTTPSAGTRVWVLAAPPAGASSPWVSDGMVSSTDAIVVGDPGPTSGGMLETNAAATRAAAGGALVDESGTVTGIVLGPVDASGTTYAVPIKFAVSIAQALRANGWAQHGSLGLDGVDAAGGPTVVKVTAKGPAARAGLRVGDVVDTMNGLAIDSIDDVTALVRSEAPGAGVDLEIRRGHDELKVHVVLGATKG